MFVFPSKKMFYFAFKSIWSSTLFRDFSVSVFLKCISIVYFDILSWEYFFFFWPIFCFIQESDNVAEKILSYNRANRAVAILCNHQRAPPKTFDQSMANLQVKVRPHVYYLYIYIYIYTYIYLFLSYFLSTVTFFSYKRIPSKYIKGVFLKDSSGLPTPHS